MSGIFKIPEGNRSPVPNASGVHQVHVGSPHVRVGVPQARAGVPQVRAGVPQFRAGVPQVRAGVPSSPFRAGVPQIRGASHMLGSARFITRAPWIGPPYTQVTPPPAFMFSSSAEKPGKRKAETETGEFMMVLII